MIQTDIKSAWLRRVDVTDHYVYLIRDRETTFYIGCSCKPLDRLRSHLSITEMPGAAGRLRELLQAYLPEALHWNIDFFTLDDCDHLVKQYLPEEYLRFQNHKGQEKHIACAHAHFAEKAMITHHRPYLNSNTALPTRYIDHIQQMKITTQPRKTIRQWLDELIP